MRHHAVIKWEKQLDLAMQELDQYLEEKYKGQYAIHPARAQAGKTANPTFDGLLRVTASFTLGIGSDFGKGYVVDVKFMTLQKVAETIREQMEQIVLTKLKDILPKYFPSTQLEIAKDGNVLKIYGDLSLGQV